MAKILAHLTDFLLAKRGLAVSIIGTVLAGLIIWQAPISLSNSWFDSMNQMYPRQRTTEPVIVVTIDEASVEAVGAWPWPRAVNGELMARIAAGKRAAVGVDIIYAEEDSLGPHKLAEHVDAPHEAKEWLRTLQHGDHDIVRGITDAPFVLAVGDVGIAPRARSSLGEEVAEHGEDARHAIHRWLKPFQPLRSHDLIREAAFGEGVVAQHHAFDGVARRTGQVFDVGFEELAPGLVIEMLRVAAGADVVHVHSNETGVHQLALVKGNDTLFTVQTEADGSVRPWYAERDTSKEIPAIALMDDDDELARLEGKLVLVGYAAAGGLDERVSPLGALIPGVEAHRQTLEAIFDGALLFRPDNAKQVEIAVTLVLALIAAFAVPRMRLAWAALGGVGLALSPLLAAVAAYVAGQLVFDGAAPALAIGVAGGLAFLASMTLSERERRVAAAASQRLDGEMAAAKRIQMGILPKAAEVFPDEQRFSIAAISEPARTVGGDLYDFFLLDDKRLFFLVGDVSGKGPEASLFVAISKALCKSSALRDMESIGAVLEQATSEIARDNPGTMFVTAFAGILDVETGALEFCSAGHEQPWLIHSDGSQERLEGEGGPPLCLLDEFPFPTDQAQMQPGDVLVVVTDGVTEAQNISGDLFGVERTDEALDGVAGMSDASAVLDALVKPVLAFAGEAEPADDLTAIIICWPGPAKSNVEAA